LDKKTEDADLWNYEQFRMMWLLLVIWFRKTFAEIGKMSPAA